MFTKDRILTLDVGASKILLCEFSVKNSSEPTLLNYALVRRDPLAAESSISFSELADTLRDLLAEHAIKPAPLYLALPGQLVFPRYVRIPGATSDMLESVITTEAAEGLPFPLNQVVWDYQEIGTDPVSGELEALLLATKAETALDAAMMAEQAGLCMDIIDAGPLALYNSVRYNYGETDGCTMVLDMGAKSTSLVFIEGTKFLTRNIPIAGNTITNEIARGLGIEPAEAEALKKQYGFVALGGNYALVEDERADRISKIIRNVATRLHSEVNRSVNFYRSQQGGSAPVRVLLTGGSSQLRHMDTFFTEKLGVTVEYLNPVANFAVSEALQTPEAAEDLFLMATSTGLALRSSARCPVEINLIPEVIAAERRFAARLPFFGISVFVLALTILCWFFYEGRMRAGYEENSAKVSRLLKQHAGYSKQIKALDGAQKEVEKKETFLASVAWSRASYARVVDAIRASMLPNTWITSISFKASEVGAESSNAPDAGEETLVDAGTMSLAVSGFKNELDNLSSKNSAGELLLQKLVKTPYFREDGSEVIRESSTHNDRVTEIMLKVTLARPLGVFDSSWEPEPAPEKEASAEPEADAEGEASDAETEVE